MAASSAQGATSGESEVIRDLHGLFVDDSMRLEHRIDIAGDAGSVISQGHSGTAHDEYVRHDAPGVPRAFRTVHPLGWTSGKVK